MIFANDTYVIFENFDEVCEHWDDYKQLKIWLEDGKLKTTNSQGKTINFTKTQAKKYFDNPDIIMDEIKQNAGLTKKVSKITNDTNIVKTIHNKLVEYFNIQSEERIEILQILSILLFAKKANVETENLRTFAKKLKDKTIRYKGQFEKIKTEALNEIYELIKSFNGDYKVLYDEIFKYGKKSEFKNSEFTPYYVSELITNILKILLKKDGVKMNNLTIYEPCGGLCSLTNAFINNIPEKTNLNLVASEISEEIAVFSTAINNLNSFRKFKINCGSFENDLMDFEQEGEFPDICLLNPPFSEKTMSDTGFKKDVSPVLKFVSNAAVYSKYSLSIFPENILSKASKSKKGYLSKIIKHCDIPIMLRLGDSIFYNGSTAVGTGNIIVIFTKRKGNDVSDDEGVENEVKEGSEEKGSEGTTEGNENEGSEEVGKIMLTDNLNTKEFKTKIYDLPLKNYLAKKIRGDRVITDEGKQKIEELIETITNDTLENHNEKDTILRLEENNTWFTDLRTPGARIKEKMELPDDFSEIQVLKYKLCSDSLISAVNKNDSFDTLTESEDLNLYKKIYKLNENNFVKVRLMDYFEKISCPSHTIKECIYENGQFNFISSSKLNNGIVGKCNKADILASKETPFYTLSVNGSVGFLFKQTSPFSKTCDVKTLKNIIKLPSEKFNLKLISIQINQMFDFSNKLTSDNLNNIEIYIYDSEASSSSSTTE